MTQLLPEDLDNAVDATKAAGRWSNLYCPLAQVGIRLFGGPVKDCSYCKVIMQNGKELNVARAAKFVLDFDNAVCSIRNVGIDEAALAALRAKLPVDIT